MFSKDYINSLNFVMKDVSTLDEVVKIGVFSSKYMAYKQAKNGEGPAFFQLGRKKFYPKNAILEWMERGSNETAKNDKRVSNEMAENDKCNCKSIGDHKKGSRT